MKDLFRLAVALGAALYVPRGAHGFAGLRRWPTSTSRYPLLHQFPPVTVAGARTGKVVFQRASVTTESEGLDKTSEAQLLQQQQHQEQPHQEQQHRPLLWLDLRDTALRPTEALAFLQEFAVDHDRREDDDFFAAQKPRVAREVDRVLISEQVLDDITDAEAKEMNLLYVVETDSGNSDGVPTKQLMESRCETMQSFVVGRILEWNGGGGGGAQGLLDPLQALDVVSTGGIVVVEDIGNKLQQPRYMGLEAAEAMTLWKEQVVGLVQFLTAATSAGSRNSSSGYSQGLILPTAAISISKEIDTESAAGIVAISCSSRDHLVRMDAALAERELLAHDFLSSATTMTDSGLITVAAAAEPSSSTPSSLATTPQVALILPLDANLWKTALDLRDARGTDDESEQQQQLEHKPAKSP